METDTQMKSALPDTSLPLFRDHPRLFDALQRSERFRRDTRLGGIFHPGKLSFREVSPNDSLHVVVDGNRLKVHVDQVCPLDCEAADGTRYSLARVVAHNLSDVVTSVIRRIRGRHRGHHCHLECEVVWVDDDAPVIECASRPQEGNDPATR